MYGSLFPSNQKALTKARSGSHQRKNSGYLTYFLCLNILTQPCLQLSKKGIFLIMKMNKTTGKPMTMPVDNQAHTKIKRSSPYNSAIEPEWLLSTNSEIRVLKYFQSGIVNSSLYRYGRNRRLEAKLAWLKLRRMNPLKSNKPCF